LFSDLGSLSRSLTKIIELGSPYVSTLYHLDLIDAGRMEWENTLHTHAKGQFPNDKSALDPASAHSNDDAFENLDPLLFLLLVLVLTLGRLLFAFLNPNMNLNRIPRLKVRKFLQMFFLY